MDLETKMRSLRELLLEPAADPAVRTDSSVLVVYPPEEENEFRDRLQGLLHVLAERGKAFRHLDLTTLPFEILESRGLLPGVFTQELDDAAAVKRGLARALQEALRQRVEQAAAEVPSGAVILSATSALYPFIKFADLLADLRHLHCRIVVAFPGHEEGGKLHFMNQRDGYNYLAVTLS
ncbi:MAG TPA: BREX protein BrxB domain-containing protein [Thermoanaerobaculia bacterium]|nr:BREX protein BrxB domain-containing protein [Thermoanaerobaculia bacterium]